MARFLRRGSSSWRKRDPELEDGGQAEHEERLELGEAGGEKGTHRQDYRKAGYLSEMFVTWATPLVNEAYRREVDEAELWELVDELKSVEVDKRLAEAWQRAEEKSGGKARMVKVMLSVFGPDFLFAAAYMLGWLVAALMTNGYLIVELLGVLERAARGEEPVVMVAGLPVPYRGFYYTIGFFVLELMRSLCVNRHWELACLEGIKARASLGTLLFQKSTRLRRNGESVGQLLNLISNDIERVREAFLYGLFLVTTPVTLVAVILLGLWILGPGILAGFVVLLLGVPIQAQIANVTSKLRRKGVVITDRRVTLMNEILKAAQLIKLYAWEKSFMAKLAKARSDEMVKIRLTAYTKALNTAFSQAVPIVSGLVAFLFHTLVFGEDLTASQAFAVLALLNISRFPLAVMPLAVRFVAEALVALRRAEGFLRLEEILPETSTRRDAEPAEPGTDTPAIELRGAQFEWAAAAEPTSSESKTAAASGAGAEAASGEDLPKERPLCIDALRIEPGTLCAVVGTVGAGKSSFFSALLGDMRMTAGEATLRGSVAYVAQNPWIFSASVVNNILLGRPYDEARFNECVRVCALQPDLDALPDGRKTEIGERGINLSGGQKARLALARAVYADADVYLLDDVLSAVDAHVSATLWNECIAGKLKGKTVVLATHAVQYLPSTDHIVVLDSMRVIAHGPFDELSQQEAIKSILVSAHERGTDPATTTEKPSDALPAAQEEPNSAADGYDRAVSSSVQVENRDASAQGLMTKEDRAVGAVSGATVRAFAKSAGGSGLVAFALIMFWASEGSKYGGDAWLAVWADESFGDRSVAFYSGVYSALVVGVSLLMILRGALFAWTALRAAQRLHNDAFLAVMQARMDFFQTTPLGRILARFSSDVDKVDVLLVDIAEMAISLLVRCFLSVVVICAVLPAFLIAIVPVGLVYARMLNYTRRVVRQMKRMDSMSRSPLMTQFQSISLGLTNARAYGILDTAITENRGLMDDTTRAYLGFYMSNRWVAIRIDFITTFIITLCALLCVIFASAISPGLAGLGISSAAQTAGIFQFATRQAAELEAQFTSVERLRHFIEQTPRERETAVLEDSPTEAPAKVDAEWPRAGTIQFKNYSTRYREGLPRVLKDLSFTVQGGSKTAIVGRTGSGKSTTLLSCFRVLEAISGRILVDGIDIAAVPLEVLRSQALSVVPQDATLFSGTIRYNLDPFDQRSDEELWEALRRVHLDAFVRSLGSTRPGEEGIGEDGKKTGLGLAAESFAQLGNNATSGLEYVLEQSGGNLSAGQRQLFCFARALLRNTRIICIDEGTSSVDEESDARIQATLREACQDRTLLVIAHRLQTVRQLDQIVVLERGRLAEHGAPDDLLAQPNSHFRRMWDASRS